MCLVEGHCASPDDSAAPALSVEVGASVFGQSVVALHRCSGLPNAAPRSSRIELDRSTAWSMVRRTLIARSRPTNGSASAGPWTSRCASRAGAEDDADALAAIGLRFVLVTPGLVDDGAHAVAAARCSMWSRSCALRSSSRAL